MPKPKDRQRSKVTSAKVYITQEKYNSSRFDPVYLENGCKTPLCIVYGARVGINWDIFNIAGGAIPQMRMVQIGKLKWSDKFIAPHIEPWAVLAPGEKRTVTYDTSGGDGSGGRDGGQRGGVASMNGDGTLSALGSIRNEGYANASLNRQVGSYVTSKDGRTRKDPYSPVQQARLGYIYAIRVKDESRDYYLLIRVDELKRGERIKLSYKKLDLPDSEL